MTSGAIGVIIAVLTMTTGIIKIDADVVWDPEEGGWVASARNSSGKTTVFSAKSQTRAVRRLQSMLALDYGKEVELTPKLRLPRELLPEYREFQRKYKQFTELKDYINNARKDLGFRMVDQYEMPITTVAPLLGLSPQRFGMMKQETEIGVVKRPGPGRPPKTSDEDD